MKNTRRSFLRLVGVAPLAGKLAAEEAAKSLAGIGSSGAGNTLGYGFVTPPSAAPDAYPSHPQIAKWLADKAFRAEVESAAYANNRHISYIDVDLASKKSFSLAAKVTFQRQRNVQREVDGLATEHVSPWSMLCKKMNPFG